MSFKKRKIDKHEFIERLCINLLEDILRLTSGVEIQLPLDLLETDVNLDELPVFVDDRGNIILGDEDTLEEVIRAKGLEEKRDWVVLSAASKAVKAVFPNLGKEIDKVLEAEAGQMILKSMKNAANNLFNTHRLIIKNDIKELMDKYSVSAEYLKDVLEEMGIEKKK